MLSSNISDNMSMKRFMSVVYVCLAVNIPISPISGELKTPDQSWENPDNPCTETDVICTTPPYTPPNCSWCSVWRYNTCDDTRELISTSLVCPF